MLFQSWENGFYLGLGPGAVSAFGGGRFAIPPGLARYRERAASGQPAWDAGERLDREAAFRETVIMGLRLIRGVSAAALQRRCWNLILKIYLRFANV